MLTRESYWTINEYCDYWKISRSQVNRLMKQGLPFKKVGTNAIRIPVGQANEWLDKQFNY